MQVEEYLRNSLDTAVNGTALDLHWGNWEHTTVQWALIGLLAPFADRFDIVARPSRVAGVLVWRGREAASETPLLAVEILSPEDRLMRMQPKIQEHRARGIPYVWLIDPYERLAWVHTPQIPAGRVTETLWTDNPRIEIRLNAVIGD